MKTAVGPPAPTNPDVYLARRAGFRAAVLAYGGYSNERVLVKKAAELQAMLDKDGVCRVAQTGSNTYHILRHATVSCLCTENIYDSTRIMVREMFGHHLAFIGQWTHV